MHQEKEGIFGFKLDLYILEPYITQKTDFT